MESSSSAVLGGAAAPRASGQARTLGPVASARPPEVGPRNLASALLRRDAPPRQRPGPLLSLCCSRRLQRSQADGVAPWRSLLRLTRAQRKGGRNGRGVVRHSPVEPIHPPVIIHGRGWHACSSEPGPSTFGARRRERPASAHAGLPCGVARARTERSTARDDACRASADHDRTRWRSVRVERCCAFRALASARRADHRPVPARPSCVSLLRPRPLRAARRGATRCALGLRGARLVAWAQGRGAALCALSTANAEPPALRNPGRH